jgi:hypothetical protein
MSHAVAAADRHRVRKLFYVGRAACVLVALGQCACGGSSTTLNGRYYSETIRGEWLEFLGNGTVVHGASGDTAPYRLDGDAVLITLSSGTVRGQIARPSTIRFGDDSPPFAGVWVASDRSDRMSRGSAPQMASGELLGRWRIPGETDVFELRPDGTYTWGLNISGTYQVLEGARIRRKVMQSGQLINPALEEDFVIDGGVLRLTMRDGSVTTYERAE